jgi:cobalt-zinc-cadmium efflux system outer membrane protein
MHRHPLVRASVLGALAAACVDAPRRPLDAVAIERDLAARSLRDPELRDLCVARLGASPAPWPPASIDMPVLTLAAWRYRPELGAARAEIAIAEARVQTAGTLPNPRFSVQPGVVSESGTSLFLAAALEFAIPTGGKRQQQVAVAEQGVELARLLAAESAWRIYVEVRDAVLEAAFAQRAQTLAERFAQLRTMFAEQVEALVRAGAAASPDLLTARIEADRACAAAAQTSTQLALARAHVAAACGVPAADLVGHTLAPPTLMSDGVPEQAVLERLDLQRGLAEYELAERALELELRKQYPDVHLGPGYEYDQGARKYLFGIGVDLPLFDRNQGPIAEALAQRDAVAARFREREAAALAAVDVARAELGAAAVHLEVYGDDARARVQKRRDAAVRALAAGALDRTSVTQAEFEVIVFEQARLDAERARLQAQAHFEDALQRSLDPTVTALARPVIATAQGGEQGGAR